MAAWLVSALRLLGIGTAVTAGAGAVEAVTGRDIPFLGTRAAATVMGAVRSVRRRRRRALTQSDKNDIAFIAATLGDTAARKFALIIAARVA